MALAEFALANRLWESPKEKLLTLCAKELANGMRQIVILDDLGRRVRALHAAKVGERNEDGEWIQETLWGDMRPMDRDFMLQSFQQRRSLVVGNCRQLQNDVEFYNHNHPNEEVNQMIFDFTDDVAEAGMPTEYRPPKLPQKG